MVVIERKKVSLVGGGERQLSKEYAAIRKIGRK